MLSRIQGRKLCPPASRCRKPRIYVYVLLATVVQSLLNLTAHLPAALCGHHAVAILSCATWTVDHKHRHVLAKDVSTGTSNPASDSAPDSSHHVDSGLARICCSACGIVQPYRAWVPTFGIFDLNTLSITIGDHLTSRALGIDGRIFRYLTSSFRRHHANFGKPYSGSLIARLFFLNDSTYGPLANFSAI